MNTERLHSLIHLFIEATQKHNFVKLLQNIEAAYTQSVQSPNAENAQAFSNTLNTLRKAADEFPVSSLSASRRKLLEAIGGSLYYPENLLLRIEEIIKSPLTPADATTELKQLRTKMTVFLAAVQSVQNGFSQLGIGVEDIPKDSAEIEVLIPQSMLDGHLNGFIKETSRLDAVFSDIREVVTCKRTPLDIRSLGSGSVELYLTVDLATGVQVLTFVTAVVLLINSILQTRLNRQSLKQQDAPDKIIKDIKTWEDNRIKEQIDKLRDELLQKYKGEEGRKNELRNALSMSLKHLAARIDHGMDIDVTTAATVEQNEGQEPAVGAKQIKAQRDYIESIHKSANIISQIQRSKEPVLQLPITQDDLESV